MWRIAKWRRVWSFLLVFFRMLSMKIGRKCDMPDTGGSTHGKEYSVQVITFLRTHKRPRKAKQSNMRSFCNASEYFIGHFSIFFALFKYKNWAAKRYYTVTWTYNIRILNYIQKYGLVSILIIQKRLFPYSYDFQVEHCLFRFWAFPFLLFQYAKSNLGLRLPATGSCSTDSISKSYGLIWQDFLILWPFHWHIFIQKKPFWSIKTISKYIRTVFNSQKVSSMQCLPQDKIQELLGIHQITPITNLASYIAIFTWRKQQGIGWFDLWKGWLTLLAINYTTFDPGNLSKEKYTRREPLFRCQNCSGIRKQVTHTIFVSAPQTHGNSMNLKWSSKLYLISFQLVRAKSFIII